MLSSCKYAIFDNDGTLTQEKILYYATGGDLHTA